MSKPGLYEASYLEYRAHGLSLSTPIWVTVEEGCFVESISFAPPQLNVSYKIGAGPQTFQIPELVRQPDCGVDMRLKPGSAILAQLAREGIVKYDPEDFKDFTVETSDISLLDKSFEISEEFSFAQVSAKLNIFIRFETEPLGFDLGAFQVEPLTCSPLDATWALKVPPVLNPEIHSVSVMLLSTFNDALFEMNASS